jgi:hypothetical protein
MAIGPGKYDDLCETAREQAGALGAILIIFDGKKGSGFSVQAPWALIDQMPEILRNLASKIEEDKNAIGRS